MTLIKSISGIRGTIGGNTGDTLNPLDIVKFTSAYATFIAENGGKRRIVVGRDARISGEMVRSVVCGTLLGMGFDVIDLGLATTPTTELAVRHHNADGGIIITASHNPTQWNALKLLNAQGEFLTAADGARVLEIAESEAFVYADVEHLGTYATDPDFDSRHIADVLALNLVNVEAVKARRFRVCVDAINSVGGIILPRLLALNTPCSMPNPQDVSPTIPNHSNATFRASWTRSAREATTLASLLTPMLTVLPSSAKTALCLARNTLWSPLPTIFSPTLLETLSATSAPHAPFAT